MSIETMKFDDTTYSKLWDLYNQQGELKQDDLKIYLSKLKSTKIPISTYSYQLPQEIYKDAVETNKRLYDELFNTTASSLKGNIEVACIEKFENVSFKHASIKNKKFFRPRFIVNIGNVEPNSKIRINTGYFIKIPTIWKMPNVEKDKIVAGTKTESQNIILVPKLENVGGDEILPFTTARDSDDYGLFCVSLYTASGKVGKVQITLQAFNCASNVGKFVLTNSGKLPFKPKDLKEGRNIYNLKVKVDFTKKCDADIENYKFPLVGSSNLEKNETLTLNPGNDKILIACRKRDWHSEKMTGAGLLAKGKKAIDPIAYNCSFDVNTHCVTALSERVTLFSSDLKPNDVAKCLFLNGFFYDEEMYKMKLKLLKSISKLQFSLKAGFVTWKTSSDFSHLPNAMLVYDYNKSFLNKNTILEQCMWTEQRIFEERTIQAVPLSRKLYDNLKSFKKLLDGDDKDGEPSCKKQKLSVDDL